MIHPNSRVALGAVLLLTAITVRAQDSARPPTSPGTGDLPDGEGRALVQRTCSECHALERVLATRETANGWRGIVDDMASRGAAATEEEFGAIVAYLAEHFGRATKASHPSMAGTWTAAGTAASSFGSSITVTQSDSALTITTSAGTMSFRFDDASGGASAKWDGVLLVLAWRTAERGSALERTAIWSLDDSGALTIEESARAGRVKTSYKRESKQL